MNKITLTLLTFILVSSASIAQIPPKRLPAKPTEQSEIKADKHLEKEIQQKQLSSPPELLQPLAANNSTVQKIKKPKGAKKNHTKSGM